MKLSKTEKKFISIGAVILVVILLFVYTPWITKDNAETIVLTEFVKNSRTTSQLVDGTIKYGDSSIDKIYLVESQKSPLWTDVNIYYSSKNVIYEYGSSKPNRKDMLYIAKYHVGVYGNIVYSGTEKTQWNDENFPRFLMNKPYMVVSPSPWKKNQ